MVLLLRPNVFLLLGVLYFGDAGEEIDESIVNTIEYVWPAVLTQTSLSLKIAGDQKEAMKHLKGCAAEAESRFLKYVNEVLPVELQSDAVFAADFEAGDAGRFNAGFFRWQKRVFSKLTRIRVEDLLWDGKPVPALPGVDYTWEGLHKSPQFTPIFRAMMEEAKPFQKKAHVQFRDMGRGSRLIPWVEVFRQGEMQSPHAHTGSHVAGIFCVRCTSQRVIFEDPRGINPPFGRKHNVVMQPGDVLMFPSWLSHFFDPNHGKSTNVYISFVIQGPGGPGDFDWEDDELGNVIHQHVKKIKAKSSAPKKAAPQKSEL
eukprot:TRINITY_DN27424_c0_g2_i1.p1 TRINITY_DN27424_c0_g2~~TRINITY_DN27424_c0_g2_i1.p1  ORF type:complete len:325 (-),score=63.83 TRINITY_DN27424_c0_g2_i1:32-976(-)